MAKERPRLVGVLALLRDPHDFKKLTGKPKLPPELESFLELPEIRATVMEVTTPVLERHDKSITIIKQDVTLNVGTDDHVFLGMKRQCKDRRNRLMRITEIRQNSSIARSYDSLESDEPIKVGTRVAAAKW